MRECMSQEAHIGAGAVAAECSSQLLREWLAAREAAYHSAHVSRHRLMWRGRMFVDGKVRTPAQ